MRDLIPGGRSPFHTGGIVGRPGDLFRPRRLGGNEELNLDRLLEALTGGRGGPGGLREIGPDMFMLDIDDLTGGMPDPREFEHSKKHAEQLARRVLGIPEPPTAREIEEKRKKRVQTVANLVLNTVASAVALAIVAVACGAFLYGVNWTLSEGTVLVNKIGGWISALI